MFKAFIGKKKFVRAKCNCICIPGSYDGLKELPLQPPPPRGCAWGRIGTRFLRPRDTSPLKGANPAVTPGYRNGTESFFGLKGRPSVVIHNQPVLRQRRK